MPNGPIPASHFSSVFPFLSSTSSDRSFLFNFSFSCFSFHPSSVMLFSFISCCLFSLLDKGARKREKEKKRFDFGRSWTVAHVLGRGKVCARGPWTECHVNDLQTICWRHPPEAGVSLMSIFIIQFYKNKKKRWGKRKCTSSTRRWFLKSERTMPSRWMRKEVIIIRRRWIWFIDTEHGS